MAVVDCADLAIDVPANVTPSDDPRSPALLNQDSLNSIARSQYAIPWLRVATLKVLVQSSGTVSHACLTEGSGDSAFDRVALETSKVARFGLAAGGGPLARWTTLWLAAPAVRLPQEGGRYLPIAFPGALDRRFQHEEQLAVQASVLDYLVEHNHAHDDRGPNRALCVGIGPILPVFDPPTSLLQRLASTSLPLYPSSACVVDREYGGGRPGRLVRKADGSAAMALWVDVAEPHDGAAEVRAGYFEGGLSAADYICRLRIVNERWKVDACVVTGIS